MRIINLPDNIIINILLYLLPKELLKIICSSKELYKIKNYDIINNILLNYKESYLSIKKNIPEFLLCSINIDNILHSKIFDTKNSIGFTGYIDYIKFSDFKDTNILYGYDIYKRFYISLLYNEVANDKKYVITLFQRYDDSKYFFVNCGKLFKNASIENYLFNSNKIINKDIQYFLDLLNNSHINYKYYDSKNNNYSNINYELFKY